MAKIGDSINDKLFNSLQIKIYTGATGSDPIPTSPSSDPGIISFNQKDQWIGINGVWYKTASSEAFDELETIVTKLNGDTGVTGSVAQQILAKVGNLTGITGVTGDNVTDYTTSLYNKLHDEITGAESDANSYTDTKISGLSGSASGTDAGEFVTVTVNTAGGEVTGVSVNTNDIAKATDLTNLQTAVTNMQKTATATGEHVTVTVGVGASGPTVTVNETGIASASELAALDNTAVKSVNGKTGNSVTLTGADIDVGGTGSHSGAKIDTAIEDIYTQISDTTESGKLKLYKNTATGVTGVDDNTVHADGSEYILQQGGTAYDASKVVAKFNIEKDSFVKTGEVVRGSYADNTFTPSETGEYYIHLAIGTSDVDNPEKDLYIPAESLVDSYTANNTGKNVTIEINSTNNTISAQTNIGSATGTSELNAAATGSNVSSGDIVAAAGIITVTTSEGKVTSVTGTTVSADAAGAAAAAKSEVIGATSDATTADTIHGAKNYAKNYTDNTIAGLTGGGSTSVSSTGTASSANSRQDTVEVLNGVTVSSSQGKVSSVTGTGIQVDKAGAASKAYDDAVAYAKTIISWEVI